MQRMCYDERVSYIRLIMFYIERNVELTFNIEEAWYTYDEGCRVVSPDARDIKLCRYGETHGRVQHIQTHTTTNVISTSPHQPNAQPLVVVRHAQTRLAEI